MNFSGLRLTRIYRCAGHFRDQEVSIQNASGNIVYRPPTLTEVPQLVGEMCDYVNANWGYKTPIHLSAYAMWRLNWIHPFLGGNGRTARAFSYVVLCVGLKLVLPANQKTIPQLIEENREPYTVPTSR